jgi:hypothetical protein
VILLGYVVEGLVSLDVRGTRIEQGCSFKCTHVGFSKSLRQFVGLARGSVHPSPPDVRVYNPSLEFRGSSLNESLH